MARTARAAVDMRYHALNRANRRAAVFFKPSDQDAFVAAIFDARARLVVDLLSYCLMPNPSHRVLLPRQIRRSGFSLTRNLRHVRLKPDLRELPFVPGSYGL